MSDPKTVEEFLAAISAVVDGAEGRSMTDEEVARFEELEGGLKSVQRTEEILKRNAAYNAIKPSQVITGSAPQADDTLERAFEHYLRTGQQNSDLVELRAQSEGTATAGGYLVPEGFRNKLVDRLKDFGGLASAVEEITTESGNTLPWPTLDDTGNVGEIVAENGTFSGGADLVFGEAQLGAYKYMAGGAGALPLRLSWELIQDAAVDIEALVSRKLAERIHRVQAPHWVSGTGTGQPKGIITGKTPIEIGALTYANLLSIVHAVDPAYRAGAVWAFNDATLQALRGIMDANDRPLLSDSTSGLAGAPGGATLLGYPVVIDQGFSTYAAADDDPAVGAFGNLREGYVIRRVKDITIVVDPYTRAANGQTQFTAWARADGTQQNPNAYVTFSGAVA